MWKQQRISGACVSGACVSGACVLCPSQFLSDAYLRVLWCIDG